ncbi:bifunctional polynucleotide phosphatase/kinase [Hepatocystis sp. ex Piliocolobus tephrosceles]|nr:bifunctional polynucleotide phosphatase/kinase [Hepatocystis sp. ex Piliocolobus tephrosceles]
MKRIYINNFNLQNENWKIVDDSLLYRIIKSEREDQYNKILSFDLDGTLILSRTFLHPAQDENDYIFYNDNVIDFLKKKESENYKIIIFSNQRGVGTGKISLTNIINRVDDIINKIGIPLECYLALKNDKYRKPRVGMFNFVKQNNKCKFEEIIYVGDNANRIYEENFKKSFFNHLKNVYQKNNINIDIENIKKSLIKDHSDTDLKFALNINCKFYSTEEFFLNVKNNLTKQIEFVPSNLIKNVEESKDLQELIELCKKLFNEQPNRGNKPVDKLSIECDEKLSDKSHTNAIETINFLITKKMDGKTNPNQVLIILIGAKGCGKTFFCNKYFPHFSIINTDKIVTKEKCENIFKDFIYSGNNIIINSINLFAKNRLFFICEAKKINQKIKIYAIYFNYSKDLIIHLNTFKLLTNKTEIDDDNFKEPTNFFIRCVEKPEKNEYFDKIITLKDDDFIPSDFKNEEEKNLFFSYLH